MPARFQVVVASVSISVLLGVAIGCGGSGEGGGARVPGTASCAHMQSVTSGGETVNMRGCVEWTGVSPQQVEAYRLGCGTGALDDPTRGLHQERTFAEAPCSREGALGACAFTLAGVTQTGWYYDDDSGITLADIQSLCAGGGATFVPP